jgi:hypothetical protein
MYKTEDILQAAQNIRPFLKELAGDEAEKIGQELDALLKQFQSGAKTDTDILRLLTRNEKTSEWTEKFFESKGYSADGTKKISLLPGNSVTSIGGRELYTCPGQRDKCAFSDCECKTRDWARMGGKDVPMCREKNIPFIRKS